MAASTATRTHGRHRSGRQFGPGQAVVIALGICTAFWLAVGVSVWWAVR